jgi:hypothetical protein
MNYELFLELQHRFEPQDRSEHPDGPSNPGNSGGIDPSGTGGGNFPKGASYHIYGLLAHTPQQHRNLLRLSSLSDLRINIEGDAPQDGRIGIYSGRKPNHIPIFLAPLPLAPLPGNPKTLKIPDIIVQAVQALNLFAAEHTLGIELTGPGISMQFTLSSILQ